MDEHHELPKSISEIHLGFLSGKHYIGSTDVGKCVELDISFNNGKWKVRAKWICDDGSEDVCEKIFNTDLRPMGIFEEGAWEKSPWNKKTAE